MLAEARLLILLILTIISTNLSLVACNNNLNKHIGPLATFVYIYADRNQCRRILKYACCLWSVCQSLLSRKPVNKRCLAMLSVPCI